MHEQITLPLHSIIATDLSALSSNGSHSFSDEADSKMNSLTCKTIWLHELAHSQNQLVMTHPQTLLIKNKTNTKALLFKLQLICQFNNNCEKKELIKKLYKVGVNIILLHLVL